MEEILKVLDTNGEMNRKEIYSLLKTNSKKLNSEISKKIKSFNKIDDFFNHYSNQTSLFELLNKVKFNSSKNYDEIFSSFNSNIEQYISCFTQIIISVELILKTQGILNKIFSSSKQYLSKLKMEKKIENISQENLFFFIENFLDISASKTSRNYSPSSPSLKFDTFDSSDNNLLYFQKFISDQCLQIFPNDDFEKTLKILNNEPYTPIFGSNSVKNLENYQKENCQNIRIRKSPSLTLSGEQEINSFNYNIDIKDKKNNSISPNDEYNNKNTNIKNYENLLVMINNIYKKCIINSEEKIRLKLLVIAKSKKLENFYYNTYKKEFIDEKVLRSEITKLIN